MVFDEGLEMEQSIMLPAMWHADFTGLYKNVRLEIVSRPSLEGEKTRAYETGTRKRQPVPKVCSATTLNTAAPSIRDHT